MKTFQKYFTYLIIVLITVVAVYLYNSVTNKPKINEENSEKVGRDGGNKSGKDAAAGDKKDNKSQRGQGGGGRVLPVSFYIADYEKNNGGLLGLGSLVAKERVDLVSEVSGRVIDIRFKEGEFVRRGTVLVKLNDDELQTQLKRAQYQYGLLKEKLERQKILLNKDAVSREDFDQVQTEYNVLSQDIEQLKSKIDKCEVKAPFDGMLGFRNVSLGAYLVPNSKITTLVDIKNLVIEFSIPEKYATKKLIGSIAKFTVQGSTKEYSARVYAIDPELDVKTRSIMFRAAYTNSDGLLRPGMSAKVSLATGQSSSSIYVPNEALISDISGKLIWIIREGKAKSIIVKTGVRTIDKIEILDGINQGDSIITTGLMQVRPGSPVKPVSNK
jgi:membrane fusion protein (multidrug efflux system)